ncbi:MAG TPA: toll/interleukin-1 receptor domain-containing protein, partial [Pyrinomonadaceae bacterium]|nr:toll/interleukin-1 receptor domain-containing protein [Pyrinomonadaceae bacterium]
MAHQVFISYAIEDKSIADAVCKALEQGGVKCWYAPRDVPYAVDYEEAIVDAIAESKLMLLVLSLHSNDSKHVKREVQNASREEPQVPVLPFQIEDVALNKSLKYYIGSVHWLSALTPPLEDHLEKLVGYVQQRLPEASHDSEAKEAVPATPRRIRGEDEVSVKRELSQTQTSEDPSASWDGMSDKLQFVDKLKLVGHLPENRTKKWMRFVEIA